MTNIPRIKSIEIAIAMYDSYICLQVKDICELFGCSKTKAQELVKPVIEEMAKKNITRLSSRTVSTEVAYEVWGIDIQKLRAMYKRQQQTGLSMSDNKLKAI